MSTQALSSVNRTPSTINRIIFMGTPHFALPSLKALHASGQHIVAVYTQPPRPAGRGQKETPSPVHQFALEHGLAVYTPTSLKTPEVQAQFAGHGADVAVVVAYGLLLPQAILDTCPMGCLNIHPSALPRFRGAAPIQRTIMAGDSSTEVCIMQMNAGLDTGDVLLRESYTIPDGTSSGTLHDTLAERAAPLLLKSLAEYATLSPQPQAEQGVTYAPKITKDECRIDWKKPARDVRQHILGLSPAPGACFAYGDELIKLLDAEIIPTTGSAPAGTVLDDALTIACGEGALRPLTLQRPNKKRMSAQEALRGFSIPIGTVM